MGGELINVFLLGISFMFLCTALITTSLISQSVLEGVMNETTNGTKFHGSGYISQAILNSCFSIASIAVPAVILAIGPAMSMFIGAVAHFIYVLSYISPVTWMYYTASALVGVGAALIWTGQGVYLTVNSNESTISRNTGIFWTLIQLNLLFGNLYIYLSLKTEIIGRSARYSLFSMFSVVAGIALAIFLVMVWRSYLERRRDTLIKIYEEKKDSFASFGQTLKTIGQLLKTRNILLVLVLFTYLGLSPTFFLIVYGTCIGHYKKYGGTRKRYIGLHGIFVGAGEIFGGAIFGFITKPKTSSQKGLVVLISFTLQIIYYYFVFINIPSDASFRETDTKPYVDFSATTSHVITFAGSFIIGLGDSGLNTQLMNTLASRYKQTASSVFAIFKLLQALGSAVASSYAGSLEMQWQLLILVIFLFIGTIAFLSVLFDDTSYEISTFVTVQENDNDGIMYQQSMASSFG